MSPSEYKAMEACTEGVASSAWPSVAGIKEIVNTQPSTLTATIYQYASW